MMDETKTNPAAETAAPQQAGFDSRTPGNNPYDAPPFAAGTNPGGWTRPHAGEANSAGPGSAEAAAAATGGATTGTTAGAATGGWPGSYNAAPYSPGAGVQGSQGSYSMPPVAAPLSPDNPSPALAASLGLIPGVGAMYNGQFAKGLAHLAIFAILVSLSDNVNGIFGLFVAGWIFYQAFEAYHTAQARRAGLPLPNAFGLNDIGERLGFGRNWPGSTTRPAAGTGTAGAGWTAGTTYAPPPTSANANWAGANWAGYVPPTAFPSPPPAPFPPGAPTQDRTAIPAAESPTGTTGGWSRVPYTNVADQPSFATGPGVGGPAAGPLPGNSFSGAATGAFPGAETGAFSVAGLSTNALPPERRFPVGAVLLILLGGVFLLSNIAPNWHLNDRWLLPLLLTGAAVWVFVRRYRQLQPLSPVGSADESVTSALRIRNLTCALRLPALLLMLAVMFALNAAGWLTIGQSWPLLLIVLGVLLLLERTLGRSRPPGTPSPGGDLAGSGRA